MRKGTVHLPDTSVLLIEENPAISDAILTAAQDNWSGRFAISRQNWVGAAAAILRKSHFDVILVSIQPPKDLAIDQVRHLCELAPSTPVIAMGVMPEADIALDLIRNGAEDYLIKQEELYPAVPRILRYTVERCKLDERYQHLTGRQLEVEALLAAILRVVSTPIMIADEQDRILMLNPALTADFGWSMPEAAGQPLSRFLTPAGRQDGATLTSKDGRKVPVRLSSVPVQIEARNWRVLTVTSEEQSSDGGQSFKQNLAALVQSRPGRLVTGRVQMVSIDEIRRGLGDRWEAMADRIYANAETIIRKRLATEDVFTRNNDGQFIICFADLDEAGARFKAQAIQKELRDKLIGENIDPELAAVTVETATISLSPRDLESVDDFAALIAKKFAHAAEEIKRASARLLAEITQTGRLEPQSIWSISGGETNLKAAVFDPGTRAKLEQIASADDPKIIAQIDALMLGRAAEYLLETVSGRSLTSIIAPIHFATLYHRKHRDAILTMLRQLPEPVRNSLVISVRSIPEDVWPRRITEVLCGLRPYSRSRMVHLSRTSLGNINLREAGVALVALEFDNVGAATGQDAKALAETRDLVSSAGAQLLIGGIPNRAAAARASALGAHLVAYR